MEEFQQSFQSIIEIDEQLDLQSMGANYSPSKIMFRIDGFLNELNNNDQKSTTKYQINAIKAIKIELLLRYMGTNNQYDSYKPEILQLRKEGIIDKEIKDIIDSIEKTSIVKNFSSLSWLRASVVFGFQKDQQAAAENIIRNLGSTLKQQSTIDELQETQFQCPYLYASIIENLIILSNIFFDSLQKYNCLYCLVLIESIAWKKDSQLFYDKIVEQLLHYAFSSLYNIGKSINNSSSSALIKSTINQLQSIEKGCNYRHKLQWVVKVTIGKLSHLINEQQSTQQYLDNVNNLLKAHYVQRLSSLSTEIQAKNTFTQQKMTQLSGIPLYKNFEDRFKQSIVLNEIKLNSLEELFCQLISLVFSQDIKKQKQLIQQQDLQIYDDLYYSHFHETQIKPEFIYHLILIYNKKESTRKVLQLTDQFLMKEDDIYRQSKIPSLFLIRLKVLVNYHKEYQQGLEIANYLVLLAKDDPLIKIDQSVKDYLKLNEPKKKAFYYYIGGVTNSIYSDSNECIMYAKRKMVKQNTLQLLKHSYELEHMLNCQNQIEHNFIQSNVQNQKQNMKEHQPLILFSNQTKVKLQKLMNKYQLLLSKPKATTFYFNCLSKIIKLAKIEQMHHNIKLQYNQEFTYGYNDSYNMQVEEYFGKDNTSIHPSSFITEQSLLYNGSNIMNPTELKCFITLKKLLTQMTTHDQKNAQLKNGQDAQVKKNEDKVEIKNKLVNVSEIVDYQSVAIFTIRIYLQQNKIEEAKQILEERLSLFRDLNPEIKFLELYIKSINDQDEALTKLKELIQETNQGYVESIELYCQIVIQQKNIQKLEKAFIYLNHCLKLEYRNPRLWELLGNLYKLKANQITQNTSEFQQDKSTITKGEDQTEREFNMEKSVFCFAKATKYESLMSSECLELLKLIPKYIN